MPKTSKKKTRTPLPPVLPDGETSFLEMAMKKQYLFIQPEKHAEHWYIYTNEGRVVGQLSSRLGRDFATSIIEAWNLVLYIEMRKREPEPEPSAVKKAKKKGGN